ncbi:sigma 54-interacting transcriptional regulator [Spirosoma pulveris]
MKILISWNAFRNDFFEGKVNRGGPTYTFYQNFYTGYDRHVLLSSGSEGNDLGFEFLLNELSREWPARVVEPHYMAIHDIIDLQEVKTKVETLLLEFKDMEIDIFFSPGTSIMQLSWYICHTTLGLKTRLLQTRRANQTASGKAEVLDIQVEQSTTPYSAVIREQLLNRRKPTTDYLLTDSIKVIYDRALKVAQTDHVTCLIYGESGTGKEHLASYIHQQSSRRSQSYVTLNCSALSDDLLESRLFGYKKGAFTGAIETTKGLLAEADGGTVFLDEIGDISIYMQQLLLRVLQQREFLPVGETKPVRVNVRIVAATHRNLIELCQQGKFRWDLFYRLAVVELELPSLRERSAFERVAMIDFFINQKQTSFSRPDALQLEPEVLSFLMEYPFKGNLRELENVIESLYIFCDITVSLSDLPKRMLQMTTDEIETFEWQKHEKQLIERTLHHFNGNQAKACQALGYGSINTLKKKLTDYGIQKRVE